MGVSKDFSAARWAKTICDIAEGRAVFGHADCCDTTTSAAMTVDNAFSASRLAKEIFAKVEEAKKA